MTTLVTRHSETGGVQPTGGTVSIGELCVNTSDGKLFTSSTGSNIVEVLGGGGGGGELPNGSAEGQMLKWTASGTPTWSVTDVIKTTTDANIAIGGAQFSASYKLSVTGATYMTGTLDVTDKLTLTNGMDCTQTATFGQLNCTTGLTTQGGADITCGSPGSINLYTDAVNSNQAVRRGYADGRYVQLTTNQTINGTKTFGSTALMAGINVTGPTLTGIVQPALGGSGTRYVKCSNDGGFFASATLQAAEVEFADTESLPDKLATVLNAFAVALDATPTQLAAVTAALTTSGL